jgi:hypothetical protein
MHLELRPPYGSGVSRQLDVIRSDPCERSPLPAASARRREGSPLPSRIRLTMEDDAVLALRDESDPQRQ